MKSSHGGQRRKRERRRLSGTAGAGCSTAGGEELGEGVEEKKGNKRTKEMPQNLAEQDSEQTP